MLRLSAAGASFDGVSTVSESFQRSTVVVSTAPVVMRARGSRAACSSARMRAMTDPAAEPTEAAACGSVPDVSPGTDAGAVA